MQRIFLRTRVALLLAALLVFAAGAAGARTLVVYPLDGQDLVLGVAVADAVATSLSEGFEVAGPAVAPALVPPLIVEGGFINPTGFLGADGVGSAGAAALLRDALGADVVISGRIAFTDTELVASLWFATPDGVRTGQVRAPQNEPGLLAEKAAAVAAARLGVERPPLDADIALGSDRGDTARAVALIGAGLLPQAEGVLEGIVDPTPRDAALLASLRAIRAGEFEGDPALIATAALSRDPFDEAYALAAFERYAEVTELPAAALWVGALAADLNDSETAEAAFDAAAVTPYGRMARASWARTQGRDASADLNAVHLSDSPAALLGAVAVAQDESDLDLEKTLLRRLTEVAPELTFPFDRLSGIAFDEDDALAAAQALAVLVELDPEDDRYWTNYGWAWYLLGFLDRSEEASRRAIELDPGQFIALYNLGLVEVVTDRLDDAMTTYFGALRFDPEVDDEAIRDLENALELYPDAVGVHYALATLYEADGRRDEAADQFDVFLARADGTESETFVQRARERVRVLRAPPPPIEISPGAQLALGLIRESAAPFHPGDPLSPVFEVFTPGEELPDEVEVRLALADGEGEPVAELTETVELPDGAIGFVIDRLSLEVPDDAPPGAYGLTVEVTARGGRSATTSFDLEIEGEPQLVRQLIGRNIVLQALQSGQPLYGERDLGRPEALLPALVRELQEASSAAEEALPTVESGRFEGLSGGALFQQSGEAEVADFLRFLLATPTRDAAFTFVDAYAQWALDGAPATPDPQP